MKKQFVMKFAASGALMSAAVIGCTPGVHSSRPVSLSAVQGGGDAQKLAREGQEAINEGQASQAVAFLEQAVAKAPRDAGYRMTLAELYLKSGRFESAEAMFSDVLALNPENRRAALTLALTRIALGRNEQAVAGLSHLEGSASRGDVGLAYALAGETQRAVSLLESAAREPTADGRVRQNLALAYALAGDWQKARLTAAQDLSPAEVDQRLQQWAAFAKPAAQWDQVSTLLGVVPANDPGRPVHLALAPEAAEPVAFAQAAPSTLAPASVIEEQAQPAVETAAYEAAPAAPIAPEVDRFVASIDAAPPPPPVREAELPSEEQVHYAAAAESLVTPQVKPRRAVIDRALPAFDAPEPRARRQGTGGYVVQLGAYRSAAQVEMGWAQLYRRYGLSQYSDPLSTTIELPGRGTFHRLSVAGFDSEASARAVCGQIKSKGGACFVRAVAGDRTVQWASRYRNNQG